MQPSPQQEQPRMLFGLEIARNSTEVEQMPPEQIAQEAIDELIALNETEKAEAIIAAAHTVERVVSIRNKDDNGPLDIFTAGQLMTMSSRVQGYLGTDIKTHIESLQRPVGYAFYVGRLATYYTTNNTLITSSFGAFENRHVDPAKNGTGPQEKNSRGYAVEASQAIIGQLKNFYQSDLQFTLKGPTKKDENSNIVWERGIAECQFLVLDYVRDQISRGHASPAIEGETTAMTINDVEQNILTILTARTQIVQEVKAVNPYLVYGLEDAIANMAGFTREVFHRGRPGQALYLKEPVKARRAIFSVLAILEEAARYDAAHEGQEEIPILEL